MSTKKIAIIYRLFAFLSLLLPAILAHVLPAGSRHINSGSSFESPSLKVPQSPSSSSQPPKYPLSFPPSSCSSDMDCIGRNATSRLYFDPFGRCDVVRKVCACREGYHRVQLRVKSTGRGRRALLSSAGNGKQQTKTVSITSTALPQTTSTVAPVYISKCVPESRSPTELEAFLRSTSQHYYGRACLEDRDCEANLICRPLNPAQSRSRNLLPPGLNETTGSSWNLYANRTKRCRCPNGQHWNKHSRRCEWPHYDGPKSPSSTSSGTVLNGGTVAAGSAHGYFSPMSIDLKLFEIVLEVAFLIACLLGYRACSKNCCRDDENRSDGANSTRFTSDSFTGSKDGATSPGSDSSPSETCDAKAEVKSDEESIISRRSSAAGLKAKKMGPELMMSGGSMKLKKSSSGRVSRKRRSVGRFCRRERHGRSNSPYGSAAAGNSLLFSNSTSNFRRLSSVSASMSRSSSASTRNLLVKVNPDDGTRLSVSTTLAPALASSTPCYNCRLYKVYSPTARCQSCRSSLPSGVDGTSSAHGSTLDLMHGSKTSSLLEFDGYLDEMSGGSVEGKKSLLLLPPYKQKPIRRSEEVGVPPHLRAPYRDSQPFWLK